MNKTKKITNFEKNSGAIDYASSVRHQKVL